MPLDEIVRQTFEAERVTMARTLAVPEVIAAKLVDLIEIADGATAAVRRLVSDLQDANEARRGLEPFLARARGHRARHAPASLSLEDRITTAANNLRQGQIARVDRVGERVVVEERYLAGDYSTELPTLEAKLTLVQREIDRLTPRVAAAQERANAAGRLVVPCKDFIRDHEAADFEAALADMRAEAARITVPRDPFRLPAELARVRAELQALVAERAAILRAPVPLEEARARVMAIVDRTAPTWACDLRGFFSGEFDPTYEPTLLPDVTDAADGFRAFVFRMLDDRIRAALLAELEREAERHGKAVLGADERAKRLATVDQKARTAAVTEELLILHLERAHVGEVLRREDASPEIVLCTVLDQEEAA